MEHHFKVEDAIKYGVDKAVLLYNFRFWLQKAKANRKNVNQHSDGKLYYWTYNSSGAYFELFPYMNERTIRRQLVELEEVGAIFSGNFNKKNYDKTKWYTMSDFKASDKMTDGMTQNDRPIPDIKPDRLMSRAKEEKETLNTVDDFIEENYEKDEVENQDGSIRLVFTDKKTKQKVREDKIHKLFSLYVKNQETIRKAQKTRKINDSKEVKSAVDILCDMQGFNGLDGNSQGKYVNSIFKKISNDMGEKEDKTPQSLLSALTYLLIQIKDKSQFDWDNMTTFSYLDKYFYKITKKVLN